MPARNSRLRSWLLISLVCFFALVGCLYMVHEWRYEQMKKYFDGPFIPAVVCITPTGVPASYITVGVDQCSLGFYPEKEGVPPLLALKSPNGEFVWCRDLSQIKRVDRPEVAKKYKINDMRFHALRRKKPGYEVQFFCTWTGGTNQEGIARLGANGELNDLLIESSEPLK